MVTNKYRAGLVMAAFFCALGLAGCGGGTSGTEGQSQALAEHHSEAAPVRAIEHPEELPDGVSAAVLQPDYGLPASEAEIDAAARTLGAYFNGRYAGDPKSLMGEAPADAAPKSAPSPQPVYRFFNTRTGVHFYTISAAERDQVVATLPWFNLEGTAFFALRSASAGLSPIHRFYNLVTGTHFYTINEAERQDVATRLAAFYRYEGVSWYGSTAAGTGWTPIHRFFNRATGTHFYTADEAERQNVIATLPTFNYEGIGYYIRSNEAPFLSGAVAVNGLVRNAVVCLDLNTNNACDAGEPTSPRTGANGAYAISFSRSQVSEEAQAAASLIAPMVPGAVNNPSTTIDQADGLAVTATPYVLRLGPDLAGQINPLTTLVASGMAAGMTEAQARGNVAVQLGISAGKIDSYQDDPVVSDSAVLDNARLMAVIVAQALEDGVELQVGNQTEAISATQHDLRTLRYSNANNYRYLDFSLLAKPQGQPGVSLRDQRAGLDAGAAIHPYDLYLQAYLGPGGWVFCDDSVPITATLGMPNRSVFCNTQHSVGYRTLDPSPAGRSMAEVVSELHADPFTPFNAGLSITALNAVLGSTIFPPGSALRHGPQLNLNRPVFVNNVNTDARVSTDEDVDLEMLIASYPTSAANAALPGPGGSISLGLGTGTYRNLRVAFSSAPGAATGPVQFYECDLDPTLIVASNCTQTQAGSYTIETIHGVRVMSFSGHAPTVMDHERLFAEARHAAFGDQDWVFLARRQKPYAEANGSFSIRLNGLGWQAMKTQLGLN